MSGTHVACLVAGLLLVSTTAYDLIESVVLPRPAIGHVRLSIVLLRGLWRLWRAAGRRLRRIRQREGVLGSFGPLAVILLLLCWTGALVIGYGLILDAVSSASHLGDSLYLSAAALLTFGLTNSVPATSLARLIVSLEAANGLGMVAMLVSLLFLLFSAFERREVQVITLDAIAGAPPSGVHLLETCAELGLPGLLDEIFDDWKLWAAQVLESHLAFPTLVYFRSSHDNEAWLNSFGAVMDAANLVLTTTTDVPHGRAELFYKVGRHLVDDLAYYFRYGELRRPGLDRHEFDEALERLRAAGYGVRDGEAAWQAFAARRLQYIPLLHHLARYLDIVAAPWIGDRSYLPHREARP